MSFLKLEEEAVETITDLLVPPPVDSVDIDLGELLPIARPDQRDEILLKNFLFGVNELSGEQRGAIFKLVKANMIDHGAEDVWNDWFSVRRDPDEIVDFLNEIDQSDITPLMDTIRETMEQGSQRVKIDRQVIDSPPPEFKQPPIVDPDTISEIRSQMGNSVAAPRVIPSSLSSDPLRDAISVAQLVVSGAIGIPVGVFAIERIAGSLDKGDPRLPLLQTEIRRLRRKRKKDETRGALVNIIQKTAVGKERKVKKVSIPKRTSK